AARRPGRAALRWPDRRRRKPPRAAGHQPRVRRPDDSGGGPVTALLGSLLRPHAGRIGLAVAVVLIRQVAQQAGPLLVAYAIDSAVPALRDHRSGPLVAVAVLYLLCAIVASVTQYVFVT